MALEKVEITSAGSFRGEFFTPPDKSISHRAVILSSLAKGRSVIKNLLRAKDVESTINAFRAVGIEIVDEGGAVIVSGKGLNGLSEPSDVIDCGNSGTTIRLISGVLAANPFFSVLTGDASLRTRPMARVIKPLSLMGAEIAGRADNRYPPLAIRGRKLNPIEYEMPVASAQVKSALILAGLHTDGETRITEPVKSRDHTENMLAAYGGRLKAEGLTIIVKGGNELSAVEMEVPGDFSSAAFFIVASLIIPGSEVIARNVGVNGTRTGLLKILEKMGARVELTNMRTVSGEPVADILSSGGACLKAVGVTAEAVPSLIDEFPVLCVAAAHAEGTTTIRGAAELRVKESDRISSIASELRKMGAEIEEYPDGLSITGRGKLKGADVESHDDHRIAMAMAIAGLAARGRTVIRGASAVDISFPGFFEMLRKFTS